MNRNIGILFGVAPARSSLTRSDLIAQFTNTREQVSTLKEEGGGDHDDVMPTSTGVAEQPRKTHVNFADSSLLRENAMHESITEHSSMTFELRGLPCDAPNQ
jgi:thymidylate synthase ThyX